MITPNRVYSALALPAALMLTGISQCHEPQEPLDELEVTARITRAGANLMPPLPADPLTLDLQVDYHNSSKTTTFIIEQQAWFELSSLDGQFHASFLMSKVTDDVLVLEPGESAYGVPFMKGEAVEVHGEYPCGGEVTGVFYAAATILDIVYEKQVETDVAPFNCVY